MTLDEAKIIFEKYRFQPIFDVEVNGLSASGYGMCFDLALSIAEEAWEKKAFAVDIYVLNHVSNRDEIMRAWETISGCSGKSHGALKGLGQ